MKVKKVFFMIRKFWTDVFNPAKPYNISKELHSSKLGEYYFLFEEEPSKLNRLISGFDERGIPVNKAYIDVETPKLHYYPISIGQFGLAVFNSYIKTNSEEKKNHFMRIADWFYENRIEDEKLGVYWLTDIPKPEYKITRPWKSAFTQSRAISILLRAWQLTNEQKYFETASRSLIPFNVSIADNGAAVFTQHGKFYEEYAASEPTMVLDGHIFSLLGLYDFYRAVPGDVDHQNKTFAKQLFDEGVESLIYLLPEYDLNFWLRFNLCRMTHYPEVDPCTIGYLRLVVLQLKLLHNITKKDQLLMFHKKFNGYDKLKNILRMYPLKYRALKKLNRI